MKKYLDLYCNQRGVTLIELLVVIFITGILAGVILEIYRVALISWKSADSLSNFAINTINIAQNIAMDIHEANKFQQVKNNRIVLIKKNDKVRYTVRLAVDKTEVIRESTTLGSSEWVQNPKFPIAYFSNNNPTISFKQVSSVHLNIKITSPNFQFQTKIAKRSSS